MVAFFYISLFLFAVVVWFVLRRTSQAPTLPTNKQGWLTPPGRALFADEVAAAAFVAAEAERAEAERRAALLQRARGGDVSVLDETQPGDALYRAALDALAAQAASDADLQSLAQYVLQHADRRATPALAQAVCARWQAAPTAFAFGDVMRLAALSDDAAMFEQVLEAGMTAWRAGRLPWLSAAQLSATMESEYWLLAPEARNSGAGYLLKQKLVAVRRELAAVAQR
jgi:hypothetical protein